MSNINRKDVMSKSDETIMHEALLARIRELEKTSDNKDVAIEVFSDFIKKLDESHHLTKHGDNYTDRFLQYSNLRRVDDPDLDKNEVQRSIFHNFSGYYSNNAIIEAQLDVFFPERISNNDQSLPPEMNTPVEKLGLDSYIVGKLKEHGINTVGRLAKLNDKQLSDQLNIGALGRVLIMKTLLRFNAYIDTKEGDVSASEDSGAKDYDIFDLKIETLEITPATMHPLQANNIKTVGDLVQKTEDQIAAIPKIGKKSMGYIQDALEFFDLKLGMTKEDMQKIKPKQKRAL